ncbi:hypothetical protein L1072_06960 [Chromohalobacter japonicus]|nr:hypothetical protein [Chromohalobacter japonicus]MCK0752639.1 hypothetical protein [Chromohalobacter japonicus]
MFKRILVVCTGNICRSPVVAALLKALRVAFLRLSCPVSEACGGRWRGVSRVYRWRGRCSRRCSRGT